MARYEEYIDGIISRDEEAFASLYDATKQAVYAMIVSIVRDSSMAEDLMQETYMTVIEKIHQYERGRNFLSWILVIARNKAIDYYRERKKTLLVDQEDLDYIGDVTPARGEQQLMVGEMLDRLSETERSIFLLHIMSDLPFRQIAPIMELPLGTVLWHYSRAIKKIKEY
ncbi:MAG: RNA polymerase sigma factor [Bacilli bacterium]|nr:RNA polymerase sigma factor [Bacilli bacterium]